MERVITLVDKLAKSHVLSREEFSFLLDNIGEEDTYLYGKAREAALANYGNKIYVRGLMEFSNYCCLLYTSPSPRDISGSRMPSSA